MSLYLIHVDAKFLTPLVGPEHSRLLGPNGQGVACVRGTQFLDAHTIPSPHLVPSNTVPVLSSLGLAAALDTLILL